MSVTAPTLTTTVTTDGYRSEIDANFLALQQFAWDVASHLAAEGTSSSIQAIRWIDHAVRDDGIVGTDSFVPTFDTDERVLTLSHPDMGSGAVIDGRVFNYSEAYTKDLEDVLADDNAFHRVAVGLRDEGAPVCSVVVVQSSGTTDDADAGIDLLLFTLEAKRNGSAYDVKELRREAGILLSRQAFEQVFEFEHALTAREVAALPNGGGALGCGFIVPWDCEVVGAHARLATASAKTDGVTVEVRAGATNVLAASASWAFGEDGTVRAIAANSPATQLSAGTWVHVHVTSTEDVSDASDLTVVLRLRRIYLGVFS